jgi:uncharacterized protein (UPF0548 family)
MAGWIIAGRPAPRELDALLTRSEGASLSYAHVGSTLHPASWPGREMYERSVELGSGDAAFDAAADALSAWACHRGIRARVWPPDAPLAEGTDVLITLPAGPCAIVVPDRVVWTLDEPDRFGFAYGTVDGHQERGEEAFIAERRPDGSVRGTIRVDARTATVAATAVAPVVRIFQKTALKRYLVAWKADVQARVANRV